MRSLRSHACQNIEKKKQEEEGLEEKLGPRLRFPLQFNSSQGHLDCHLFQIWNMTRLSKMSRVLGNRTTLFDYWFQRRKFETVGCAWDKYRIIGCYSRERGRCQPNVVEIIALVTEARGRLTLLIILQNSENRTLLFQPLEQRCFPTFDQAAAPIF